MADHRTDNDRNGGETVVLPSGHKVPIDAVRDPNFDPKKKRDKVMIDKLPTVTGSIAGASSRFLKDYQSHRERELRRVEDMETGEAAFREREEFEQQRNERKRVFEEEAARKRERRQRRKVGRSSEGLSLPSEIVQRIKKQETSDRASLIQKSKPTYPYAVCPPEPPERKRVEEVGRPAVGLITILEEE
jgi:hypothetical protein